jgi:hypothetical protein
MKMTSARVARFDGPHTINGEGSYAFLAKALGMAARGGVSFAARSKL